MQRLAHPSGIPSEPDFGLLGWLAAFAKGGYTPRFMLKETLDEGRRLADAALERLLPPAADYPSGIHRAMRHSVFAGGKRLRPILAMEGARLIAGTLPQGVEELGAAL